MRIIAYGVGNVTDRELGYCYCYIKATKSKTRSNIFKTHSSTNFQIGRRSFCSWSNNNNEKSEPLATMVVTNVKKERDIATQMKPQEKLLYKKICDMATLKLGLARVKNKSPGVDGEVKADITEERLKKLLKSLKVQKYQPRSNKRVSIPKAGGGIRYLGISSAIDKVVQATIVNLLTPIVEPIFIKHSYGFRPGKGCHDALHAIRYGWQNVTWTITVDVEKCFNTVNHDILLKILEKYMDQACLELISKLIKVGYVEINDLNQRALGNLSGIAQGSILSPLLCNIYFNEFDQFMVNTLVPLYTRGTIRAENLEYKRSHWITARDKEFIKEYPELEKAIKQVKHNRTVSGGITRTVKDDLNFNRLYYVRYADDFIIGFVGSKIQARIIYKVIKKYLQRNLGFVCNELKSNIRHGSNSTKFLGTLITWERNPVITTKKNFVSKLEVIPHNRPLMTTPIKFILQRLELQGFVTKVGSNKSILRGTSNRRFTALDNDEIVKRFNSMIAGILNYYSFVNWKSQLWTVIDLIRKSCALTLADKLKLRTSSKAFNKFGRNLSIKDFKGQEIASLSAWPKTLKSNGKFMRNSEKIQYNVLIDNIENSRGTYFSRKTKPTCEFEGCQNTKNLEAHHINPMASVRRKDLSPQAKLIIAKNRKVITICPKHHQELHKRRVLSS